MMVMAILEFRKMIWNSRDDILAGLDLGTQNTKLVVAEIREDGQLNLIGHSKVDSMGIRKGEVHHHEDVVDTIHRAVLEAEKSVDGLEINQLEISLTGRNIGSFNNTGSIPIVSDDREITHADVEDVMANAKMASLPQGHAAIHTIRQLFKVDDRDGVLDPVGLLGGRLEVGVHIIHGMDTGLQNAIRCVFAEEIEMGHAVFSGLASALTNLAPQNKQQGAILLDIGAGTTEFVVFAKGMIRCTGVVPIGGNNVTNDLSIALKIPFHRAEQLKVERVNLTPGAVKPVDSVVLKTGEFGLQEKSFALGDIQTVARARFEEIFRLVLARVEDQKLTDYIGSGVFITGGASRTLGLSHLAEGIFGMPVTIPNAHGVDGAQDPQQQPEFSTAIGLVKYAHKTRAEFSRKRPRGLLGRFFGK
jgi:cell division protein FtsA